MKNKIVTVSGKGYTLMHTTYSDNVKRLHRDIARALTPKKYHEIIDAGVTDSLFSTIDLRGEQIITFINDCEISIT